MHGAMEEIFAIASPLVEEMSIERIPLSEKTYLQSETERGIASSRTFVSKRPRKVDISRLQKKIRAGGPFLWDPLHQSSNVSVRRAGHDIWGIDKVIFVYCDDYLFRVYHFPWLDTWKSEIFAILHQIGIPLHRMIRCLLAKMPPKTSIPVHHDTGFWVKRSHRIHIPIFTNSDVDFFVGKDENSMERIEFKQGFAYELNNARKHSVNNRSENDRVHLILDYIEEDYPLLNIIQLVSTDILHQSRRTLDLAKDFGTRMAPSFMIIGAQKAGTTSLYHYITQHDLVVPAKRKETHYLDWRWNDDLPSIRTDEGASAHRKYYYNFFEEKLLQKCPSLMTGEATPSYLFGGSRLIHRAHRLAPNCKYIVIVRNPIERAYSQYCMAADTIGSPQQLRNRGHEFVKGQAFEQIIEQELEELHELGIHPDIDFDTFDRAYLCRKREMNHGGHSFLARGLYALQVLGWMEISDNPNGSLLVLSLDDLKTPTKLQATMDKVFSFLDLPKCIIQDCSAKNVRSYAPLALETQMRLAAFYAPYNERLYRIIDRDLGW